MGWASSSPADGTILLSELKHSGLAYTFLTMLPEVMDKMNLSIQLDPATTTDRPLGLCLRIQRMMIWMSMWVDTMKWKHRAVTDPQQEPGLTVGHLYLDGCLVSRSETVSSAGSSELRLVPLSEPTSQHNKTSAAPTVGYNRGPWRRNPAWDRCNLLYFEFKLGSTDAKILCPTGRGMGSCD